MNARKNGFTLIELMIVVVIIGILAAIAIPNFITMQNRAKEGSTKANMHTFQLTAEDYGVQHDGTYATVASDIVDIMPVSGQKFKNAFSKATGSGVAWMDQSTWAVPLATDGATRGIVSYGDSMSMQYQVSGRGNLADFPLVLTSGSQ